MNASIGTHGVWALVLQSDFTSKMVLLILFGMSVLSWAVVLYKLILFRIKQRQCKQVLRELKSCTKISEVLYIAQKHSKTLPGYVLIELLAYVKQTGETQTIDLLSTYTDQILDEVMYGEESYTPILAVSSAVATLLGLFGTVWGLVHAFIRISEKQSADIVTVAPGIAEALITTTAGLIVAIPALVFLHYIGLKTKDLEHLLVQICDKVNNLARMSVAKVSAKNSTDSIHMYDKQDQQSLS